MDRITVTVTNWEKYNPRKDFKTPTWFALSNRFIEHPDLIDFDPLQFKAAIYVFSQASQRNKPTFDIVFQHADRICGISPDVLHTSLRKLEAVKIIEIGPRTESVRVSTDDCTDTCTPQTDRQTNKQTDRPEEKKKSSRKRQEIFDAGTAEEVWLKIDNETKSDFAILYPDESYRERKLVQAFGYYRDKPLKKPKTVGGWKRVLRKFFETDWPKHVTNIPATRPLAASSDGIVRK